MTRAIRLWPAALLLAAATSLAAQQPDAGDRAADRIRALHDESDRLAREEQGILGELRKLEVDRQLRTEELREAQRKLTDVTNQIASLDRQIAGLESQERSDSPALRERLVSLYKLGGGSYTRLMLSTRDLDHLGQASRMVAAIAAQDRGRVEAHRRRLAELTTAREQLQAQRATLADARTAAARARTAADDAVEARNLLVRQIDAQRDLNARLTGELQAAQQQLQTTVGALADAPKPAGSSAQPLPIGPFRGDLDWPVEGALRQPFGAAPGNRAPSNGIDIAATERTPVQAIHDGTIAYADVFTGFGRLVIIDHGSRAFSLYGNLLDVNVTRGAHVMRGQTIGTVGVAPTGAAGLYFELRIDGRPVDPLQWLRKR